MRSASRLAAFANSVSGQPSFLYAHMIALDDYKQATKELVEYIEKAEPADYVWESVYYDIPANVKYMVKDGRAYVETAISECDF